MAKFELWIETDNAAFDDEGRDFELAALLRQLARRIENGVLYEVPGKWRDVRDFNGNIVGKFRHK